MNQRYFSILVFVLVLAAGGYFLARHSEDTSFKQEAVALFPGVSIESVAAMRVIKGSDSIEVSKLDGNWGLPARSHYSADGGKVRALVLKVLELKSSQKITVDSKKYKKLGVDDEAVENGAAKVFLFDAEGKELASLYVGEMRRTKSQGSSPAVAGQYVRKGNSTEVFLVAESIPVEVSLSGWLDSRVANVLQSSVRSVKQFLIKGDEKSEVFHLERNTKSLQSGETGKFIYAGKEAGQKLDALSGSQVVSALENLRFVDVIKSDDAEIKNLEFDNITVFRLENGLEYSVITGRNAKQYYAKFRVDFDSTIVDEVKKERQALREQIAASSDEEMKKRKVKEPKYASSLEAEELNQQYGDWVYKVAEYVGQKFRKDATQLKNLEPPTSESN